MMAGGHRRRPELAGVGWKGGQNNMWRGASVVQMVKMEFWKWCFGERRVGPLERAHRGDEDGVVRGGQGGVGGGGNGGEVVGEDGFPWSFLVKMRKKKVVWRYCCCWKWRRRWRRKRWWK